MKTPKEVLSSFILTLKNYSSRSIDTGLGFQRSYNLTEEQLCNLIEYARQRDTEPKEEDVIIPRWQMVAIEDVLRQANNIHHSQKKETCFDRCICKAWKWACDALGKEYSFEPVIEPKEEGKGAEKLDLIQYVTNLLYAVYTMEGSLDFDKWVEERTNELSQYYASLPAKQSK